LNLCGPDLIYEETLDLPQIADEINSKNLSWRAEESLKFKKMSVSEIRKLMGTIVDPLWRSHSEVKKELSF
jgi:hypothetical protein